MVGIVTTPFRLQIGTAKKQRRCEIQEIVSQFLAAFVTGMQLAIHQMPEGFAIEREGVRIRAEARIKRRFLDAFVCLSHDGDE